MTDPAKISYKFYGLFVLLLLLPVSAQAQKFVHAYSSISALNATFWIIQDAGFAKQEGLETELVYIPSSGTVAQATLAGEIVISPANGQVIADVGLQGGDLVAMGGVTNVVAFYIMVTPEIKTIADLKGKTVGVTRFGASGDVGIRMFLTKYGLEPVKDVPLIQLGGLPEIAAAMSKRTVHAAAFSQPMAYVAQQGGARILANLAKENIPFLHVGITTTRKFMRERRSQAKAYLRAYGSRGAFHAHQKRRRQGDLQQVHQDQRSGHAGGQHRLWLRLHREGPTREAGRFPGDTRRYRQEKSQSQNRQAGAIFRQ